MLIKPGPAISTEVIASSAVKPAAIIFATSCGAMPAALANCSAIEVA